MEYIDRAPAKSIEEVYPFLQKINDSQNNNESILWAITLKGKTKLVGTICYWNIEKEHYRAEIGYNLLPEYQGKGIMQEAFSEVVNYGFEIMTLHSIAANVNPDDVPSIKLLERNKFVREAYFKENVFYDGRFIDTVIYSLLTPGVR